MSWRSLFRRRATRVLLSSVKGHASWDEAFAKKYGKPMARASDSEISAFVDEVISVYTRPKLAGSLWLSDPLEVDALAGLKSKLASSSFTSSGTTDRAMSSRR